MALTDNLISFWELGEASGTRNDSHGTNHLTDNNTVLQAAGRVGNSADFESDNSESLSRADNASLSVGNIDFTLCAWVKLESKPASTSGILLKGDADDEEYYLKWQDTDRFKFEVCSAGAFANQTSIEANVLGAPVLGNWYFIIAWHDATANTINIQVNNGNVDSAAYTLGSYDSNGDFVIGAYPAFSEYFDGLIDQVGFWKRTLTTEEKTFLYNAGNGRSYAEITGTGTPRPFYRNFPKPILRQPISVGRVI